MGLGEDPSGKETLEVSKKDVCDKNRKHTATKEHKELVSCVLGHFKFVESCSCKDAPRRC